MDRLPLKAVGSDRADGLALSGEAYDGEANVDEESCC